MRFSERRLYLLAQALATSAQFVGSTASSKVRPYDPAMSPEKMTIGMISMRRERVVHPIGREPQTFPAELTARVYDGDGLLLGRTTIPEIEEKGGRRAEVAAAFSMAPERQAYDVIHALLKEPFEDRGSRIATLKLEAETVRDDLRRRLSN